MRLGGNKKMLTDFEEAGMPAEILHFDDTPDNESR
jgi:hypothetical protein